MNTALQSVDTGDAAAAAPAVLNAVSALDSAVQKGVLHKRNASRHKSRLFARLNQLGRVEPA